MDESRVLIIYTGGTIGMLVGQQGGYVPEPHFLTETLRSQSRFHDPLQDSLFSHSASVQGFRQWSSSGRTSPVSPGMPTPKQHTLPVRSSHPVNITSLSPTGTSSQGGACLKVSENVYEANLPSLVTPRSSVPGFPPKAIRYAILEWNPLLDSSNIEIDDWIRIASEIELNYSSFDAFLILHGTDTLAYTTSALSFLLEDLGKTVIVTGAQIPLSQLRNDATDNLMGALTIAGHYVIPECCLYFNHTLFRGNRVSKTSSLDLSAFDSPNFSPLVNVGIDIVVNWNDVIRQTNLRRFRAHKSLSPDVATLRLFPGITAATVKAFFMPPVRGVVLETFGAGNAPQRPELLDVIKDACDREVIVVSISQCAKGTVSDAYETGRTLIQAGVVSGWDLTPECALTKLSYLLSKPELSCTEIRKLMGTPLRGELTRTSVSSSVEPPTITQNMENIQEILSHFLRLSQPAATPVPTIFVSQGSNQNAAAPWSWTAAEAASTEAVLLPFLIHTAAARNDVDGVKFCISSLDNNIQSATTPASENPSIINIAGGLVNSLEPGSGQSPLHKTALHNCVEVAEVLLQSGGLVHLRDTLGHSALYYAARQGHEEVVELLVKAGATLGGLDGEFAQTAMQAGKSQKLWAKAGFKLPEIQDNT